MREAHIGTYKKYRVLFTLGTQKSASVPNAQAPGCRRTPSQGYPRPRRASAVAITVTVWPLLSATRGDYRVIVNPQAPRVFPRKYAYLVGNRVGEKEAAPRIRKPQVRVVASFKIRGTGAHLVPKHPAPPGPMMICVITNPPLLLMIPLAECPEVGLRWDS